MKLYVVCEADHPQRAGLAAALEQDGHEVFWSKEIDFPHGERRVRQGASPYMACGWGDGLVVVEPCEADGYLSAGLFEGLRKPTWVLMREPTDFNPRLHLHTLARGLATNVGELLQALQDRGAA